MERKSIAQEYYILVTDKYGVLPSMRREGIGRRACSGGIYGSSVCGDYC